MNNFKKLLNEAEILLFEIKNVDKIVTLYRVEDSHGYGPYASENEEVMELMDKVDEETTYINPNNNPGPQRDEIKFKGHEFYFACTSLRILKNWFTGLNGNYLYELLKFGYKVVEIKIPISAVIFGKSGTQCAFNKKSIIEKKVIKNV